MTQCVRLFEDEKLGLRQSKKDKTRLQLLEAALDLFSRQGFEATTINEIAAVVEISPRTLLRYFPTKEDIVVSWVEESMSAFLAGVQRRAALAPIQTVLLTSAREMLALYDSRKEFYLAIERAIASSPQISARKYEMTAKLADEVSAVIKPNAISDEADDNLQYQLYPQVLFTLIRVVIKQWVKKEGKADLEALFNEAVALLKFSPR